MNILYTLCVFFSSFMIVESQHGDCNISTSYNT